MKVLKVFGVILLLLALAAFVFWFGWLKPPAAEDVCNNLAQLTEKESGAKWDDATRKTCVEKFSKRPEFGLMPWVKRVKCVRDAKTLAEAESCNK